MPVIEDHKRIAILYDIIGTYYKQYGPTWLLNVRTTCDHMDLIAQRHGVNFGTIDTIRKSLFPANTIFTEIVSIQPVAETPVVQATPVPEIPVVQATPVAIDPLPIISTIEVLSTSSVVSTIVTPSKAPAPAKAPAPPKAPVPAKAPAPQKAPLPSTSVVSTLSTVM